MCVHQFASVARFQAVVVSSADPSAFGYRSNSWSRSCWERLNRQIRSTQLSKPVKTLAVSSEPLKSWNSSVSPSKKSDSLPPVSSSVRSPSTEVPPPDERVFTGFSEERVGSVVTDDGVAAISSKQDVVAGVA